MDLKMTEDQKQQVDDINPYKLEIFNELQTQRDLTEMKTFFVCKWRKKYMFFFARDQRSNPSHQIHWSCALSLSSIPKSQL